jgi:uncharacterized protein DUF3224
MRHQPMHPALLAIFSLALLLALPVGAQMARPDPTRIAETPTLTTHASGTFEVKLLPQASTDSSADGGLGRFLIAKQFHGDLEGTSKGQMLAASSAVKGSAGYVAIEVVTGTLNGRRGSFTLQHYGTMNRGEGTLTVSVIPDSGTDQLTGLTGTMAITITGGKHLYDLDYSLPGN